MASWKTLSSEKVYETAWFKVRRDQAINHQGKELTYSVMELHNPSVTIAAMDSNGCILLQRQYRYTIDKTIWEFPAGHSDGEEFLTAAKRELLEETGLTSNDWTDLGRINVAIGVSNIQSQLFLARDVQKTAAISDEEEDIGEQRFVPLEEIERLALAGELIDASVLSALYLIKLREQGTAA